MMKKDPTIKATNSEQESYYEEALNEMNSGDRRPGIYAKAIADSLGDEKKVDSLYLKYRAQSLMEEAERIAAEKIAAERIEAERIAEEERLEAERIAEEERLEAERKAKEERLEAEEERLEAERKAEKLEAERKAEEERIWNERLDDKSNKMVFSDLLKGFLLSIFLITAVLFLLLLAAPSVI
jgi:chemosensory pili system protein ChpA (sensor histidine kinase/response regulator)